MSAVVYFTSILIAEANKKGEGELNNLWIGEFGVQFNY